MESLENLRKTFEEVVGYDDIKVQILENLRDGAKPVHMLFYGPPGTAKTQLLDALVELPGSVRILGGATSRVGAFEVLESRTPRVLVVDEIDKMKREDQAVLLSLMESQRVSVDKHHRHIEIELPETRVYAAANDPKRLSQALLSRFLRFYFRPYSREEFVRVVVRVLEKEGWDTSFSQSCADRMWNAGITDVRQVRQIARLAGRKERIKETIEMVIKYR